MAKRINIRKGRSVRRTNLFKFVFILSSLAILIFLALILKSVNISGGPQAFKACSKYYWKQCPSNCKVKKIGGKNTCTVKSGSNNNTVGFGNKALKAGVDENEVKKLCSSTYGYRYGNNLGPDKFEIAGVYDLYTCKNARESIGKVSYTSKKVVDVFSCCLTVYYHNTYNDKYCSSLMVYDKVGSGTPTPTPYKADLRCKDSGIKCNGATLTDGKNEFTKLTYWKESNNLVPSICSFAEQTGNKSKMKVGNCCKK